MSLPDESYGRLLALRTGLRHFERWSERQAQAAGLTPAQHQLLLGRSRPRGPPGQRSARLLTTCSCATTAPSVWSPGPEAAGLVTRTRDPKDHRVVRIQLTKVGAKRLEALSTLHLQELERLALKLPGAWRDLAPVQRPHGFPGATSTKEQSSPAPVSVEVARVYDHVAKRSRPASSSTGSGLGESLAPMPLLRLG